MKYKHDDASEILSADREHPVSSHLKADGSLSQQGISCEGLQREVGVHRRTELVPGGKKQRYKFCWTLSLYQHPGCRKEIPLGCTAHRGDGTAAHNPAPKMAREIARAFHRMAQAGYDPREKHEGRGGAPRGYYWHRFVAPLLCGGSEVDERWMRRLLKHQGYMGETSSLDGMRRQKRGKR
jgi:hypothetical protein